MSFIDSILNTINLNDDDEDDFDEDELYGEEEDDQPRRGFFGRNKKASVPEDEPEYEPKGGPRMASNVVPIRNATRGGMEVCMVKPNSLCDAREIADILLDGRAVVINMEGIPTEIAQKIIDFISGACYARDGNLQKISNFIFIATPSTIGLSGDFEDLMENSSSSSY